MPSHPPSTRSRALGAELRRKREQAGLTGMDLARRTGWSHSKISRLETGDRGTTIADVAYVLGFYGATDLETTRLLELLRDTPDGVWACPHPRISQENQARALHSYAPVLIPPLLRTETYAQALGRPPERPSPLRRAYPPTATFHLDESALRRAVGNPAVMHTQLRHLVSLSRWQHVHIRVLPLSAAAHPGLSSAFTLLTYADGGPVVHLPQETQDLYLESSQDIATYRHILTALEASSLSEDTSRDFLSRLAATLN